MICIFVLIELNVNMMHPILKELAYNNLYLLLLDKNYTNKNKYNVTRIWHSFCFCDSFPYGNI